MARSFLRQVQHDTHLISRAAGDFAALQRDTLPKRLIRRKITRTGIGPLLNALFRWPQHAGSCRLALDLLLQLVEIDGPASSAQQWS